MEETFTYGLIGGIKMGCSMKSMAIEWYMIHKSKWKLDYLLSLEKGIAIGGQLDLMNLSKYRVGSLWWK
jgi:hypothetical protein